MLEVYSYTSYYECIIVNKNNASNQSASERKMLNKMQQPIKLLIKLKLMFTSYAELFNDSFNYGKKLCGVFGLFK